MNTRLNHLSFRVRGITFVEVLVTAALLVIVLVMLAPYANSWVAKSHLSQAQSSLQEAITMAKENAVKAHIRPDHRAPVTVICLNDASLQVRRVATDIDLASGQKPCEQSVLLWQTELNAGVQAQFVGENDAPVLLSEMHFNGEGHLVSDFCHFALVQEHCATSDRLMVSAGGDSPLETVAL